MGHYWNAKIETKLARSKNGNERRLFLIKINGITGGADVPFKIKTQRNDDLFSDEVQDFLRNLYSNTYGNGNSEPYWKCTYHGRNKRVSLYVVGCDRFSGLLMLDENLYSLTTITASNSLSQIYRLDLLSSTIFFNTVTTNSTSKNSAAHLAPYSSTFQSNELYAQINLNLEKEFFSQNLLTNSEHLNVYFRNLVLQSHLAWSYYLHEHNIRIQFSQINMIDLASVSRKANNKPRLFNIDPEALKSQAFSLDKIFHDLSDRTTESSSNRLEVYFVPATSLIRSEPLDGISRQTKYEPLYCNSSRQSPQSLILLKDNIVNLNATELKQQQPKSQADILILKQVIEQSNILIDLLGRNFGETLDSSAASCNRQLNEYNWYFQIPLTYKSDTALDSDESTPMDSSAEYTGISELCLNRRIQIEKDCTRIRLSVSKCGNGIIEADEKCDCDPNDLKCLSCCDMNTCQFKSQHMQCSVGQCCDDQCRLVKKDTLCRGSSDSECDWSEKCDGVSSSCPVDQFVHNGLKCAEDTGLCWAGICVSADRQCHNYWSGKSSDASCYSSFNTIGFQNGNCGFNKTSQQFIPCAKQDAQCGLLNCQLGTDKPMIKSDSFFKATTNMKGNNYECKVITSKPSVYVSDGSKCDYQDELTATSGVCVNQKCVRLEKIFNLDTNKCVLNGQICSGNGRCDNTQSCVCDTEWQGKYCETFIESVDYVVPEPAQTAHVEIFDQKASEGAFKSITLFSIIAGVSLIFLLILLISFICCRRRKGLKKSTKVSKAELKVNSSSQSLHSGQHALLSSSSFRQHNELSSFRATSHGHLAKSNSSELVHSFTSNSQNNISLTKVSHAIKQLKTKPSKSILKNKPSASLCSSPQTPCSPARIHKIKKQRRDIDEPDSLSVNDSAIKFERQVNINTILNSAIGSGHRSSRRSMTYDMNKRKTSDVYSSSSSLSSRSSSESISSSLSNVKKKPTEQEMPIVYEVVKPKNCADLSFLTSSGSSTLSSRRSSTTSSISLQLLEAKSLGTENCEEQKTDFLKVQDYLNELDMLSQQNGFEGKELASPSQSLMPPPGRFKEPDGETPQRPSSLLTPIKSGLYAKPSVKLAVNGDTQKKRLSQILTTPTQQPNAGQQLLLHLQILKQPQHDELLNLHTNTSETSSGYLSNSTTNINNHAEFLPGRGRFNLAGNTRRNEGSDYNSSTCSSSLTPPILNGINSNDKRFSYMIATGSTNTLNIDP